MTTSNNPDRYGLPYQGSKNAIARWVVDNLPPADVLVDAFAGGCAITHAALLSGKFKRVIANDITDAPQLFYDAMHGKYRDERRWIDRATFHALKDSDPYVRLCWSFGNDGKTYLYGQPLEEYKKGYHYAAVFEDYSLWAAMGIVVPPQVRRGGHGLAMQDRRRHLARWVQGNKDVVRAALCRAYDDDSLVQLQHLQRLERLEHLQHLQRLERLEHLQRLQRLERLEHLQRLQRLERLERHNARLTVVQGDYQALPLPTDETYTLYCDPPYANTNCGCYGGFDHDRFYRWLQELPHAAFISEYAMPDGFTEVAAHRKRVNSIGAGKKANDPANHAIERLFTQTRYYDTLQKTTLF